MVGGLELEPDLARRAADPDGGGWRAGGAAAERAAAALGYVARLVQRLAALLDVPLRYPLRFANSRSSILSHPPPAASPGCARPLPPLRRKCLRGVVLLSSRSTVHREARLLLLLLLAVLLRRAGYCSTCRRTCYERDLQTVAL